MGFMGREVRFAMMGKLRFSGFVLIACMLMLQSNGQAQDREIPPPDEPGFSQQQLLTVWNDFRKNLEKEFQNHSKEMDVTLRQKLSDIDSRILEISSEVERIKLSRKEQELRLRSDYSFIENTIRLFGITSALVVIAFCLYIYRKFRSITNEMLPKIAEEKSNAILGEHFSRERDKIVRLIQAHDKELQLKRTKKILVLTHEDSDLAFLDRFFMQQGFDRCEFEAFDPEADFVGRDLVLFDNEKMVFTVEEVGVFFAGKVQSHAIAFYFGKGNIPNPGQNFAFANSRVQLYGNLINSLKYQSLLV